MRKAFIPFATCISLLFIFLHACKPDSPDEYNPIPVTLETPPFFPPIVIPPDNPLTEQGIRLGKMLFYDPILSGDNTLSCAGCHSQTFGFSDSGKRFSTGIQGIMGDRTSMGLFNLTYHKSFFWDGRAKTLEEQILEPVPNPIEMHLEWTDAVEKLKNDANYPRLFFEAFGSYEITKEKSSKAMAQFLRTILSSNSKYDKYLRLEIQELTESEERGREIFFAEFGSPNGGGDCFHCHGNILFQNVDPVDQFRNNALQQAATVNDYADKGLGAVTGRPQDNGKFKVPSLRNIALTAPYMHDGRFATLEDVVDFYSDGLNLSPNVDPLMKGAQAGGVQLNNQQKQDLVNFLKTLTDYEFAENPEFANPF